MKNVSTWVFHYNEHREVWQAAKRENYNELFSGNKGNVLSSSNINTLIELVNKTDGDSNKINKILNRK